MVDVQTRDQADLYEADFYVWTQVQGAALRRLKGERANLPLDLDNLAEEIEALGRSERAAARSQLRRIIEHCLKLTYSPASEPRRLWRRSIDDARSELEEHSTPTIRRGLQADLPELYAKARSTVRRDLQDFGEAAAADAVPEACPFLFDDLLAEGWYPGRWEPVASVVGQPEG